DDDCSIAHDLDECLLAHGDDGRATGHRLEHRQAETLVVRGLHEACGAAVQPRELVGRHVAAQLRAGFAQRCGGGRVRLPGGRAGPATTSGSPASFAATSAASWFLRGWIAPTERA